MPWVLNAVGTQLKESVEMYGRSRCGKAEFFLQNMGTDQR